MRGHGFLPVLLLAAACGKGPAETFVPVDKVPKDTVKPKATCTAAAPSAPYTGLCVDTLMRRYILHLPPTTPTGKVPLVVYLHGWGSNAQNQVLNPGVDSAGWLVVYPEGTPHAFGTGNGPLWNAGGAFEEATAYTDDVKFIRALIDTLILRQPIDRSRVFVLGYSNGGMMAYRLAHELSSRIAGIYVMAASETSGSWSTPPDTVAVMHLQGLNDPWVQMDGNAAFSPVRAVIGRWRTHNGCAETPDTIVNADSVLALRWKTTSRRGDVVLVTHPGGHEPFVRPTAVDLAALTFFKSIPARP